jgi:AcrR family transcriptional regulator
VSRDEVLHAARQTFAERGYEGATLSAIGGRLGISASAVLRHAPSKEALFAAAMASAEGDLALPVDFLSRVDGDGDPRPVLRRLGRAFVPFLEARIGEVIARYLKARAAGQNPDPARLLPFDPAARPNPPQRALALIEDYFRRARRAGRLEVRDPRAAALIFLAALHSYVFLHRVAAVLDPPLPLDRYLDSLIDIWTRGALRPPRRRKRR